MNRLIRKAITSVVLWRARRRVARTCPEIAAVPPITRDRNGRWKSTAPTRRKLIHDRLRQETAR